jgi:methionine-R-sulfoxide reductase
VADSWNEVLRSAAEVPPPPTERIRRSDEDWRARLTPEQYRVTRRQGTERPFSSEMCSRFEPGRYACVCCGTELFDASEKFESGSGWPSFTAPVLSNVLALKEDRSHGMHRIEVVCNVCDAHLGHVFPDGPRPTGLRYCINAVALERVTEARPRPQTAEGSGERDGIGG